ncbi:MAG TPA: DHA2 family efflux MFS transporter permease subunit [Acidimicrobiales bacterium]|nr:DHA2 family efflux MFS transporter permease subunit [Acidimicrobiales bacterium]
MAETMTLGAPARAAGAHGHPVRATVVTGAAQFMAALDNLVVTMALPVIRRHLHTGFAGLEWTVNAYTLSFAVLLLGGAALGDRFGRRRMFIAGLALFTGASAVSALAPNISVLIAARALQGAGGALIVPLSLTLLSASVPAARRNLALGIWGALSGLAVAIGPLVGGAVVEGLSWQFIFWLNVPIGLALIPAARFGLGESHGAPRRLDLRGIALASAGLFGIVLGLVRGGTVGWGSSEVLASFVGGVVLLGTFVALERRLAEPMLQLELFSKRSFSVINVVAMLMSFGMFGAIFLLAQYLQTVQHYSPLDAGIRTLPWTGMPVIVAPIAGLLVERVGARVLVGMGLALQAVGLAWFAAILQPGTPYGEVVPAFVVSGIGMALFFVPVASLVLGSVRPDQEGIASGTNNALRELGGVFGVSVLGAIFTATGSYASGTAFVAGLIPAVAVGSGVVFVGALLTLLLPGQRRAGTAARAAERPAVGVMAVAR